MKVKDGKIVEATESELFEYYLARGFDDIMDFNEYKRRCIKLGTKIKEENELVKALRYDRDKYNKECNGALTNLQKTDRWIPVSERLPEKTGRYLCTVGANYRNPREMYYAPQEWANKSDDATWRSVDGSYVYDWFVKAWQPLPEPYKAESEVENESSDN